MFSKSNLAEVLKENGYDGIIFNHWDRGIMISCFEPNQIKSATDNDGEYSLTNDNITMQIGGSIENLDMSLKNDKVSMDVPLLIRMLEYAKEDAKNDVELHKIAERLITLSQNKTLTMNDYEKIITKYRGGEQFCSTHQHPHLYVWSYQA